MPRVKYLEFVERFLMKIPCPSLKLLKNSRVSGRKRKLCRNPGIPRLFSGPQKFSGSNLPHSPTPGRQNLMAAVNLLMAQSVRHKKRQLHYLLQFYTFTILSRASATLSLRNTTPSMPCAVCLCERTQPMSWRWRNRRLSLVHFMRSGCWFCRGCSHSMSSFAISFRNRKMTKIDCN